jgi:hypothetical protein
MTLSYFPGFPENLKTPPLFQEMGSIQISKPYNLLDSRIWPKGYGLMGKDFNQKVFNLVSFYKIEDGKSRSLLSRWFLDSLEFFYLISKASFNILPLSELIYSISNRR